MKEKNCDFGTEETEYLMFFKNETLKILLYNKKSVVRNKDPYITYSLKYSWFT